MIDGKSVILANRGFGVGDGAVSRIDARRA
jgi:hypothetical protein